MSKASDELTRIQEALVASYPAEVLAESARRAIEKKHSSRMLPFFEAVAELVNAQAVIPKSAGPAGRAQAFTSLSEHIRLLVEDSVLLFEAGRFSTSLFLAIVAIEEIGKIAVARIQAVVGVPGPELPGPTSKTKKSLRSHVHKHYLAACAGAVINSRLDRILGTDRVIAFLECVESGKLEGLRQNALYYEMRGDEQHLPAQAVKVYDAREHVVLASELLAEVGSNEPEHFEVLATWADRVAQRVGFSSRSAPGVA